MQLEHRWQRQARMDLLACHIARAKAEQRITQAQALPGLQEEADCFQILAATVGPRALLPASDHS